jgi:hydrolase, alpha/beta domain protein
MTSYEGADGAELWFDEAGPSDGEPVIVLAGGPARHPAYLGDLAGLGKNNRLIMPHQRGVGNSPAAGGSERTTWVGQAEDIACLDQMLGGGPKLVLAHSAGARIAVRYLQRHSSRVKGIVLVTPAVDWLVEVPSDGPKIAARRMQDEAFYDAWRVVTGPRTYHDEPTFNLWQRAIAPAGYAHWGEAEQRHSLVGECRLSAALAYLSAQTPGDLRDQIAQVRVPVLSIAGAEDALVGCASVRAFSDVFAQGEFVAIDECGHYPWVEQPEAFASVLANFIDSLLFWSPQEGPGADLNHELF